MLTKFPPPKAMVGMPRPLNTRGLMEWRAKKEAQCAGEAKAYPLGRMEPYVWADWEANAAAIPSRGSIWAAAAAAPKEPAGLQSCWIGEREAAPEGRQEQDGLVKQKELADV